MEYIINLFILFAIYGILAISLNIVVGYTGLLSLAQAAFYGIGAYATAILMTRFGMNFFLTVIIGMFVCAIIGFVIGAILSKFKGDYYAIVSAGLTIIIFNTLLNCEALTNGPIGIFGIGRPSLFGFSFSTNINFLILCVIMLSGIYYLNKHLVNSSFGRVLKAIREDENLVRVMGHHRKTPKMLAFVFSASLTSVAGSLFASYLMFIDPMTFQLHEAIFIFTIIIVGGLADLKGSMLGAVIMISLPEVLRFVGLPQETAAQLQQLIYGLLLVVLMYIRPQGILGKYRM